MQLINLFDIDSPYGTRSFKLMEGDLSDPGFPVDILVTSAFKGGYFATPGTVFGALYERRGILIADPLPENVIDLRSVLGTFYLPTADPVVRSLLVLEMRGAFSSVKLAMESLYLTLCLLESRGINFRTLALPPLGTGLQNISLESVLHETIAFARQSLLKIPCLEQIMLVSNESNKTDTLNQAMNNQLGRSSTKLPISDFTKSLRAELCTALEKLACIDGVVIDSLLKIMRSSNPSVLELAIAGRNLLESAVRKMLPTGNTEPDLARRINALKGQGIAPWTISYMHMLRTFSNEYAHNQSGVSRKPATMVEEDFTIALFALQRVVDFLSREDEGV